MRSAEPPRTTRTSVPSSTAWRPARWGWGSRTIPPGPSTEGRLFAGTDALDHVRIVAGTDGDGVWLPDSVAGTLKVQPGDTIELRNGPDRVEVGVDGITWRSPTRPPTATGRSGRTSCSRAARIARRHPSSSSADPAQLIALQTQLHRPSADQASRGARAHVPVPDPRRGAHPANDRGRARGADAGPGVVLRHPVPVLRTADDGRRPVHDAAHLADGQPGAHRRGPLGGPAGTCGRAAAGGIDHRLRRGLRGRRVLVLSRPSEAAVLSVRGWGPGRVARRPRPSPRCP